MEPVHYGVIGMIALAVLIVLGVRIFVASGIVGFCGLWALRGFDKAVGISGHIPYSDTTNYALSVLPLFILIGHLAHHAGIVQGAYRCARAWLGWLPGGLGIATIFAAAGFAAVSGASTATAAVFSRIALPELLKAKYHPSIAAALVAAGGTLASLIPPSAIMVVYGIITETSIGGLLLAGFIPGVISALVYASAIFFRFLANPALGEASPDAGWKERIQTLPEIVPIVFVIGAVLGGMYTGWATPTEVGALGAFIIFVMALLRGTLSGKGLLASLVETAKLSVMIFSIIWGVLIFVRFLAFAGVSSAFADWIQALGVSPYLVLFCVILLYIVLGMFMDGIGMLLLTLPVISPVMTSLGFDPIWFGIIVVKMVEIGLLTPPVGLNCYVVAGVRPDIPLQQIFRGVWPFVIADLACVALFIAFPGIVTFLPKLVMNG
ncbi:tripartite ATP-independent transporter DctM subunit [Stella humosa]|uniref:TRAP transporter large permease protein n=1 Tax=Stella humosa TaxID=94 RepID=A0A3N1KW39_9PROT|nr:TRAP transporter large permease [Stella humosa]ROP83447.1 tripartite ATP-independent transporter DctM subunit [Stella humosa]BBK33281.1 C4-dicarboxylate ABC transporter [Stella humosa]